MLEARGADVIAVGIGRRGAGATIAAQRPDVLVSDIGHAGQDGYALIQRGARAARQRGARMPAAALTAYARAEDRQRALRGGLPASHLAKPVEPARLVAVVAKLASDGKADARAVRLAIG